MATILTAKDTTKKNVALFKAFLDLTQCLGLDAGEGSKKTTHGYDPIQTGSRQLKNALCIEASSTSFFTSDKDLLRRLSKPSTGFRIRPAPLPDKTSRHNEYRFRIYNVTPASLETYRDDFSQIVKDSVAYVQNPIAGIAKRRI